jgi:hypothetical protein
VGMLRYLRKKLGETIKTIFGKNSAMIKIRAVEIIILIRRINISDTMKEDNIAPSKSEKERIKITRAKVFPMSIVAMYWPGLLVNSLSILEPNKPCFLSSSIRSLFDATNAISMPEK